ncbi:hypothetical protein [Photobacterium sanguinicancri]|uniref:Uncharacterized protein n=2 Tax=Photobacterium sanguinicancri TaxID=875932 RepID=A0AAW7Y2E8_9GAMM|nr:hypothetical protein [Photobacterium sanguinicancri]MDO6541604.1 hypothetical protein [Photobacterium sanguinicancri]
MMNPLSYTLHTLNAQQLLVEPEIRPTTAHKSHNRMGLYLVIFVVGVVLGLLY